MTECIWGEVPNNFCASASYIPYGAIYTYDSSYYFFKATSTFNENTGAQFTWIMLTYYSCMIQVFVKWRLCLSLISNKYYFLYCDVILARSA